MNKMKNIIVTIVIIITMFTLTSCKVKEQTFSANGITVTLNTKFKQQDISGSQVIYVSRKIGFMGNKESKKLLNVADNKLDIYTKKVVEVNNLKEIELFTYNQDGVVFMYGYYTAEVNNIKYKYMLVTKEGEDNYYTMNFWSLEKNFNKNMNLFIDWAKTIVVE
jgi:uncharacterized ion transporter superfamily protein YfcC